MKDKTPLLHNFVCFQMQTEAFHHLSENLLLSQKLQREPFLTMRYTINSSPLLVTKLVSFYCSHISFKYLPIVTVPLGLGLGLFPYCIR